MGRRGKRKRDGGCQEGPRERGLRIERPERGRTFVRGPRRKEWELRTSPEGFVNCERRERAAGENAMRSAPSDTEDICTVV